MHAPELVDNIHIPCYYVVEVLKHNLYYLTRISYLRLISLHDQSPFLFRATSIIGTKIQNNLGYTYIYIGQVHIPCNKTTKTQLTYLSHSLNIIGSNFILALRFAVLRRHPYILSFR